MLWFSLKLANNLMNLTNKIPAEFPAFNAKPNLLYIYLINFFHYPVGFC